MSARLLQFSRLYQRESAIGLESSVRYPGHTARTMLREQYDKVVTKKDATAFWKISAVMLSLRLIAH